MNKMVLFLLIYIFSVVSQATPALSKGTCFFEGRFEKDVKGNYLLWVNEKTGGGQVVLNFGPQVAAKFDIYQNKIVLARVEILKENALNESSLGAKLVRIIGALPTDKALSYSDQEDIEMACRMDTAADK